MKCPKCGRNWGVVQSWPVRCPCGHRHEADPSGGLWRWGDMVAVVTKSMGIKPCGGCKKRQQKLNDLGAKVRDTLQ